MKQTEIPEALAATLIHLLPKEKISISDIEDILKETLLIFKSIPLDIPKPKKRIGLLRLHLRSLSRKHHS